MSVEDIRGAQSRRYIREISRSSYHPADYSDVIGAKKELFNESKAWKEQSPQKRDFSVNSYASSNFEEIENMY